MLFDLTILAVVFAAAAALFALLSYIRIGRKQPQQPLTGEEVTRLLLTESDRTRPWEDERARAVREELAASIRGFEEMNLKAFRQLSDGIGKEVTEFGNRLDRGVTAIDVRTEGIGKKLDEDIERMGQEAMQNRDALRQAVEAKLDDSSGKQATAAKNLREEVTGSFRMLGEGIRLELNAFGNRLDNGVAVIDNRAESIGKKLDDDMGRMGQEATQNRDALRQVVEGKLEEASAKQVTAGRELREEIGGNFLKLGSAISDTLNDLGKHQKERLENVTAALSTLSEKNERSQEALKQTVEGRLDVIRNENVAKLDEMRRTVDEKLQTTLEARLGESFDRVVEQLERVHKGIGEMQSLAVGVGDLKRVLSNVRVRGTFGEVQLSMLLEQFLAPEQYVCNAQTKEGSQERVEFAIRLPGRDGQNEVLLPVDSKFPHEDYERLIVASEAGDSGNVSRAAKDLENRIRQCAKTIKDKYIAPPRTTEFGILFLPTESLYAEVLRRPGFFEQIQLEHHVTLTGPSTLAALLNALQMGFRSVAIGKRSSEVWQILGAVKTEFAKYNTVVDGLSRQLSTAAKSVESLGVRTRAMTKKLRDVETLPESATQEILGPAFEDQEIDEEQAPEELSQELASTPVHI